MFPLAFMPFSIEPTTTFITTPAIPKIKDYLRTLQLNHNPFGTPTAELELQTKLEKSPFFQYFVNLPTSSSNKTLLDELRQHNHTIVYGDAGSGKTTFCLNLEAQCRTVPDQTLVVSHTIGKDDETNMVASVPWQALTQSLAIDLFVQATEQFYHLNPASVTANLQDLAHFWDRYIPQFSRTLRNFLKEDIKSHPKGLPIWWLDRPVVRYTSSESGLRHFWQNLLVALKEKKQPALTIQDEFLLGIKLAFSLGYQRFYLLIDVVDAPRRQQQNFLDQLLPLFDIFYLTAPIPIYLKLFLPRRWQKQIKATNLLPNQTPSFIIEWQDIVYMQQLISNRFRSAGSWIESLNALASQEFAGQLETKLIQQANGSPRRLLHFINALLDNHARRDVTDPTITLSDWQKTRQAFS